MLVASFMVTLTVTLLLENFHPYEKKWNAQAKDLKVDAAYYAIQYVTKLAPQILVTALAALVLPLTRLTAINQAMPSALRIGLAFMLSDLAKYFLHRLSHHYPSLWKFHAVHHETSKINASNSLRSHPVNVIWLVLPDLITSVLFAIRGPEAVFFGLLRGGLAILQHANIKMKLSGWNTVFSTPDLHQWHHSTAMSEANSNFGGSLIILDAIFKTRLNQDFRPQTLCVLGLTSQELSMSRLLLRPFLDRFNVDKKTTQPEQPFKNLSDQILLSKQELKQRKIKVGVNGYGRFGLHLLRIF